MVTRKKIQIALLIAIVLPTLSCEMNPKVTSMDVNQQERKQKVVTRDNRGRILKTFDKFIYRIFDSLGRQVEWYGNYNNEESNSNIHKFVEYNNSVIIAKEYVLEDANIKCKIVDSLNCSISKYYYKEGSLVRREYYGPDKDKNGKIVGHKLVETADNPKVNPFIHSLPSYLK